ncbi:hypothetical protein E2986_13509 [Frieseomelitta varia]|uniref:arginine kinase n=1 Tax=Frieseomelitta varia TaxID=561572 RepID=A0A833WAX7_9HYME|nr:hypothetical protein E2986_13509 [Frieseomelitta varia]
MEKGGNLSSVYSRLVKAVTEVEKKIRFSRHPRFGFLTFCPTNLGTTIRASVHARFPKLSEDYARFREIANMYNLQKWQGFCYDTELPLNNKNKNKKNVSTWNNVVTLSWIQIKNRRKIQN